MKKIAGVGMAWIRAEDYDYLRNSVFSDGANLKKTHAEWLQAAETGEARFKSEGRVLERVYLDRVEFPKWCAANGFSTDSKGRSAYAAYVVGEKLR